VAEERVQRRLAAILAADVVGYSRMMSRDEGGTLSRLKTLRREIFEPKTKQYGGRIFKTTGDGAFVEFKSVVDAVKSASDIQESLAVRNVDISEDQKILLRIGISLGDVIVEGSDLYGNGVNVASRMEGLAEPGGICVSGNVHEHIGRSLDVHFEDLGEQVVKNIDQPVRCYRTHPKDDARQEAPLMPVPEKSSIAVLPFQNMSGDPEQEYFADGIAEDIITDLSKISSLFVVARNSSFAYKGKAVDVREISRALGATYVLEGSVRRGGNKLRINAQLIDAGTGGHLWAERYDGDLNDIFALQDSITSQIVSALELNLTSVDRERIEHKRTHSVEAYDLYLRGRSEYHQYKPDHGEAPARYLERAIEIDPDFADAYGYLSYCRFRAWVNAAPGSDGAMEHAYELAQKAVDLDDRSSVALTRLAWVLAFMKRFDEAIPLFEKALDLDPNDAGAYAAYGMILVFWGDPERGFRTNEKAFQIDAIAPPNWYLHRALAQFGMRQYDDALQSLATVTERAPNFIVGRAVLACLCSEMERPKEAADQIEFILRQVPSYSVEIAKRYFCYRHEENLERVLAGLRKAGLRE
jgi:adenylate cyclase